MAGADADSETEFYSQAYSAPESEQFTSGPYVPADVALYDYDDYDPATELVDTAPPPRWPWVVGITAIVAAVALVASVAVLVTRDDDTSNLATPQTSTTTSAPPVQDEITTTTPPPPPPPPTSEELPPPPPPETVTVTEPPRRRLRRPASASTGPGYVVGPADHHHDACRTASGDLFGDGDQGAG